MNVVAFGKLLREQREARNLTLDGLVKQINDANIRVRSKHMALWEDLGEASSIPRATKQLVESWRDQDSSPSYEVVEYLIDYFNIDPVYFYIIVLNSDSSGRRVRSSADVIDRQFTQEVLNRYIKLIRLKNDLTIVDVAKRMWASGIYITSSILERFESGLGPELTGATICAVGEAINNRSDVMKILNYAAIKSVSKSPEDCSKRFSRIARMLDRDIRRIESVSEPRHVFIKN